MNVAIEYLVLEEVGDRMESGATEPYLCRLSDDHEYVVKGRAALARGLIAEAVCASLGRAFGLPIPRCAIAAIDIRLLTLDNDAKRSLGNGYGFASRHEANLVELGRSSVTDLDRSMLRRLFLFDYWIRNADRTGSIYGGNSNLFMNIVDRSLIVLDHNLAFDPNFAIEGLRQHICFDFWFDEPRDMFERDRFSKEMDEALARVALLPGALPDAWVEDEPEMLARTGDLLQEYRTDAFWEPLA